MFGYVRGGYARVLKRFEKVLREKGVEFVLNARVENIEKLSTGNIEIKLSEKNLTAKNAKPIIAATQSAQSAAPTSAGNLRGLGDSSFASFAVSPNESFEFDKVIFTGPSNIAAKIIPQLAGEEKEKLCGIKYQGIVCASVLMKRSLSNFYVTNVTDETPFTGIIEMSALVDKKEFGGNALVYLPKYVAPDDRLFEKSDEEIKRIFLSALEKMYLDFHRSEVVEFQSLKSAAGFPDPGCRLFTEAAEDRNFGKRRVCHKFRAHRQWHLECE